MGFALLFHLPRRYLLPASLAGMLAWGVYLGSDALWQNVFLSNLIAAALGQLLSEFLARLFKCPTTLFYIPAIVPLIPGGSLFRTIDAVVHSDPGRAVTFGKTTLLSALGIAAGISAVAAVTVILRKAKSKRCAIGERNLKKL